MPFHGKPILGIVGGIGAGKSFVAAILARDFGCAVINSDAVAHAVYARADVVETLVEWFGTGVVDETGAVDRRALAARVFRDSADRAKLEGLLHPLIHAHREAEMIRLAADPSVTDYVWDSPLLIEAGLHQQCDAVIFVDTPYEERLRRVRESRGWDEAELARREASQMPVEEKRQKATHRVRGDESLPALRAALAEVLKSVAK